MTPFQLTDQDLKKKTFSQNKLLDGHDGKNLTGIPCRYRFHCKRKKIKSIKER